jgi:uncharacterized protein (TIGR00369 family)
MTNGSDEPVSGPDRMAMSGLQFLRKLAAGEITGSPMVAALGFRLAEVEEGRVVMTAQLDERYNNGIGIVHGGYAATLLDSAMGSAVNSMMPAGRVMTTLEMKVNYVRPLRWQTGTVRCEANVLHVGGRVATAEGRITDHDGVLYAHGTTTCMLYRVSAP